MSVRSEPCSFIDASGQRHSWASVQRAVAMRLRQRMPLIDGALRTDAVQEGTGSLLLWLDRAWSSTANNYEFERACWHVENRARRYIADEVARRNRKSSAKRETHSELRAFYETLPPDVRSELDLLVLSGTTRQNLAECLGISCQAVAERQAQVARLVREAAIEAGVLQPG
jgi:DNA-directed RNA polymerase specialized sigma24 family protein